MNATQLRLMMEAGLTLEQVVAIAEAGDAPRSSGAERQRRYRERKAACDVTRDVTLAPSLPPEVSPHTPLPNPHPILPPSPPKGGSSPKSMDFDQFWAAYPAKVGKKAAERAWRSAKDRPPLPSLLEALDRYRRTKPADRDWCNPATWLNQGRWMDGEPVANDAPAAGPTFAGPAKLREAIAERSGEPYARSYVDPCRWDAEGRRLIAANPYALDKLSRDHGDLARAWKFAIVVEADNDTSPVSHGEAA